MGHSAHQFFEPWQPESPPACGLHEVPLYWSAVDSVALGACSNTVAVARFVKWPGASLSVSWQVVQAIPLLTTCFVCRPEE